MEHNPVIVVVAYNRVYTLKRLLESLRQAIYETATITLIISIDYCETNQDVINCAEQFEWQYGDKIVKKHTSNLGLKNHILECGDYVYQYEKIIILEDDFLVAPYYYKYVKKAHEYYGEDPHIAGISLYGHEWNGYAHKGYSPIRKNGDVYFGQFGCSRGQSWNRSQWDGFKKWYEKNQGCKVQGNMPECIYSWENSWGKFFTSYIIENDKYYVIPYVSLSTVFGEAGTHSSKRNLDCHVHLYMGEDDYTMVPFQEGVHYDIFFENLDLKRILSEKIGSEDICIDLYATKNRDLSGNRYILTTRKMNYKIIQKYALDMRPHDMNIIQNIIGNDIFLYDTENVEKNKWYKRKARVMYECAGMRPRAVLLYAINKFVEEHF